MAMHTRTSLNEGSLTFDSILVPTGSTVPQRFKSVNELSTKCNLRKPVLHVTQQPRDQALCSTEHSIVVAELLCCCVCRSALSVSILSYNYICISG
ncbi:hypothetical protein BaRGS_00004028 [Batillaria attramentaria]|uniref:Uncharacterized protein n=1 Tax=Batillaria attramentaria TaxID=370345 RepID=A0ABD0LYF8_9CAEN